MHLFPSSNFWPKNESNDFFPKYVFSPLLILFFFSFSLFGLFMQFKTNPNQKYSENSSFTGKYSNIHIPLTFCCVLAGVLIKSLSQAINLFVHLVYISKVIEVFVLGTLFITNTNTVHVISHVIRIIYLLLSGALSLTLKRTKDSL